MSEHIPSSPEQPPIQAETERHLEITERPEYARACERTKKGGDLIRALLQEGISEDELKPFALDRLEARIKVGNSLNTVRSMAKQGGIISEAEVNALFERTQAAMLVEPPTETDAEKEAREARELAEMLAQYE